MGIFIVLLSCVCVLSSSVTGSALDEWKLWKLKYNKNYINEVEEEEHRAVWMSYYDIVTSHNNKPERSFTMEMNHLADKVLTRTVLVAPPASEWRTKNEGEGKLNFVPSEWDWRQKGAISPVKSQGQLGDAVSFAATECVESYGFINNGKLVTASTTETHDCCYRNPIASTAAPFRCIHDIGGLCSDADYPMSRGQCMNNTCSAVIQINGGKMVPKGDEASMMAAVYEMPVLALVDASHVSFQLYRSGVYSEPQCSGNRLDHALQVVGYGSENGQDYWICKNSWGTSWGMKGYIMIARNKGNMCGIASMSSYPV